MVVRIGGSLAVLAGVMYALTGILDHRGPLYPRFFNSPSDYLIQYVFAVALLSTMLAIASLHVLQRRRYGWTGTVGAVLSLCGYLIFFDVAVEQIIAGSSVGPGSQQVGSLVILVGMAILGLATFVAGVLPRWCGAVLMLGFPLSVWLGSGLGGWLLLAIMLGVVWAAVGYALLSLGSMPGRRSSRAT